MKTVSTTSGPFRERPHYGLRDMETICTDELRATGLYPTSPGPIRIDRFIEKRFGLTPRYDDLPTGVLGYTKFSSRGVEDVVVAKRLSEEGSQVAERRISTTLAHEAGHGLLHAHLFALGTKPRSLFDDSTNDVPELLCRDISAVGGRKRAYDGSWWEFQANRMIGGFMLPRGLVQVALERILTPTGSLGALNIPESRWDEAVASLSDIFDVNPIVARIRLDEVYPDSRQLSL